MSDLPKGWVTSKIDSLCAKPEQLKPEASLKFNYIDISSVDRDKKLISEPAEILGCDAPSRARKIVNTGDVLVSMTRPNLNAVAKVPEKYDGQIASTGFDVLKPFLIESDWLFSVVKSKPFIDSISGTTIGALYPACKASDIRSYEMPLPPLAEQKRIVEKLDEVLAQVDTIKARLDGIPDLLKRFRQSVLASAVSGKLTEEWRREADHQISLNELLISHRKRWEKSKLDDFKAKNKLPKSDKWKEKYKLPESVVDESVWLTPSNWCWASIDTIAFVTKLAGFEFTKFVKYVDEGTVPVIKAENVGKDGFKNTNFSLVPKSIVEALPRSEIFGGELLVTFVGAGVGQVCRVPSDRKYFLGPNVALTRVLDTNVDERYIEFLFKSNGGFKNLLSQSKGAAQPSLSMTQIRQTSVPIPPLGEQKEIVRLVDQYFAFADTIEAQVKKAQARVDNLTQSILAKAFRGELVPQDPNDEPADKLLERIAEARKEAEALAKAAKKAENAKKRAAKKAAENN
ncbi:restriction endonuclease subunit S [Vibrio mediterranei]|uniref:restriction endonuclease subunit S n=1 Tax=Vibrio mediterranei TaxID=689 RepID=UPI002283B0D8|nr:restriction endonuclease subunit S [Vibrio mediterranei]MCY9854748.1 restriction endonuclease subunit S [Vibrio mediterranei]